MHRLRGGEPDLPDKPFFGPQIRVLATHMCGRKCAIGGHFGASAFLFMKN